MTQCPIDDIFIAMKMMLASLKFRILEPRCTLKLCLKREKPILFSGEIRLFRAVILSKSRVLVHFLEKRSSSSVISCMH